MHLARWIISLLSTSFSRERSAPLIRTNRIDWNHSLIPRTVQVNGNTIFYVVKGEGKPLILIHGYGAAIWLWEKQIDLLSQRYRVYALDLLGHGFSDRPRIAYTPEAYIHFFRDFMDAIGVEKATLIGNSMGGGLAWSVAGLFPERVDKLILIDCIPPDVLSQVRNDSFKALVAVERYPFLLYLLYANRNRDSIRWIFQECVTDKNLITPEIVDRQYQFSRIKGTTWSLYSTFRNAKAAARLKEYLSRIDRPTLLIWGEEDLLFPPSVGEGLQRAIAGSTLQVIEKSGHIPMWETPDKVTPLILAFLSG
ncbi:MAG: alpha/beta hydrolase [Deltaproteobacteria bacterium]